MKKLFIFIGSIVFFSACYPSKYVSVLSRRTALPPDAMVRIVGIGQTVPDKALLLGQIIIGETNNFNQYCIYEEAVQEAVKETRNLGGNLFQITDHDVPTKNWSHCHLIKGDVYFIEN